MAATRTNNWAAREGLILPLRTPAGIRPILVRAGWLWEGVCPSFLQHGKERMAKVGAGKGPAYPFLAFFFLASGVGEGEGERFLFL